MNLYMIYQLTVHELSTQNHTPTHAYFDTEEERVYVNTRQRLNSTVIILIRYMSILHPLKPIIPKGRGSLWVICGIWAAALLASIPNIVQTTHFEINGIWVCTTGESS